MPKDSCIRTTHEQRFGEDWTVEQELLALLIEVTSVSAAGRNLRKPINIPRPKRAKDRQTKASTERAYSRGVSVLERSAKAVAR